MTPSGIALAASRAFGDGSHETTWLCLQAVRALAPRDDASWRLLDFGSGTGILAGGAAKDVAWSYEQPFDEAAAIEKALAFYPKRVDAIEVTGRS